MTPPRPLAQVGVLVTRPAAQAAGLASRLESLGAEVVLFPALAILPPTRSDALKAVLAGLEDYDLAIFVSPSAAEWGLAAVGAWPDRVPVAAVGRGTARTLTALGVPPALVPESGADGEHLLALPELAEVAGQRILIVRGEAGREELAATLRTRGARVDYAECYRRARPKTDPAPLHAALGADRIQAVTAFSGETLDNLIALLADASRPRLFALPLFVPHPRIASYAATLGFRAIHTTDHGESGLIAGLVEYFAHARHT